MGVVVIMGRNILLFYFMFQTIYNSLEEHYFFGEKLIILVERGRPPLPRVENSIEIIFVYPFP